jgi:plastocyanin
MPEQVGKGIAPQQPSSLSAEVFMFRRLALLLGFLVFVAGCSNSSSPTTPTNNGTPVSIPTNATNLGAAAYSPNPLTVTAGTTVTWTNNDNTAHTATSDTSGVFDTGSIPPGGQASATLGARGTVTYHCTIHPGMVGSIIVQ